MTSAQAVPWGSAGPADAAAVVLVHGSCVTWHKWREPMDELSRHYRVVAPDLPGHGARAHQAFGLDAAVNAIEAAMDAEQIRRAVVVGSSLGGYVALAFADRYPERTVALALSGATMNFTGLLGPYMTGIGRLLSLPMLQPLVTRLLWREVRKMCADRPAAVREEQLAAGVFPRGAGDSFRALAGRDFSAMLRRYPGPVAVINGERDRANRRTEAQFVSGRGAVTRVVVADAGHSCSVERPEAFVAALREFMGKISWVL